MSSEHIDEISGIATTGHEWDGIRELNNPLPRWWVITFYITIAWALAYTIAYPAWPMISSATQGVLGFSSRNDVKNEMAAAETAKAQYVAAIQAKSVSEIAADNALREFAVAAGGAAFRVNCVQCHGSGAQGSTGFPNLNDDDWLWGGKTDQIQQTITHGIRFATDADTRQSEMTAFADVLKPDQIAEVSAYVASLSGPVQDKNLVGPGAKVFADNCAACHGENAKGNRELGAPDLTDAIWLYGSSEAAIAAQVRTPHNGVMPAWGGRLGETTVKELAVYVHSLGGGE
ncbi:MULTISPECIES: cytochrome-c oxidase, cbb3-type subunit III [unclassified Mesorhizobium]|uniref:cytochrome-c oxidase, cbb3-type subunit III n=1 Tax=unclassified Mesorhizobium TaxID=325217 RepID=UPI000FCCBC29|nr:MULTISPECIES: cytochrome-c oxidase, cbb3-type subunit III [unclassified Mesorhizobium]MDG4906081.1 cytochrome-c oxidase, cbb3-type subunit III [Mesorhizobium sp. WSM4898]RUW03991.1 cytochrome-c oxidase, cbb3-type subunit III [Mesorhizobium sp. M1A.F.Ca.IN.020.04.1.1]RUW15122.1 cytochrome-c oxidase, cbb3-type subunit III [Mesorhizobium sp. M1A.F.Ca.IN.020.03.1.1]RUW54871.1 cytochrome-c oxidase, cbb3-type subunit III [Mesorhizobium sp. M1A.F.Ca.ET.072.01.1.1]RWF74398.1 MAG: cytochrome-c oxida